MGREGKVAMGNQGILRERWITSPELLTRIEERLEDLDKGIKALARTWARDNPDVWEDLAQEARLAIYLELKENPESPRTHLFQRARHVILDYRKKGRSVDGKLHRTFGRPHVWMLASLDGGPRAPLAIRSGQASPVEDLALARVVYGELRERLSGQQAQYLALRIQGYQGREVDYLLSLTKKQGFYLRKKIKEAAQECLRNA